MAKGSAFERDICKQLSQWWCSDLPGIAEADGPRDDIFWRATTSGARATQRARKGKRTAGSYGDITAIDPIGKPFTDLITLELKRGYNKHSIQDLIDKPKLAGQQKWEEWHEQVTASQQTAGTPYWMILAKRDQREPLVLFPFELQWAIQGVCVAWMGPVHYLNVEICFRHFKVKPKKMVMERVVCYTWKQWLTAVTPKMIRKLARRL